MYVAQMRKQTNKYWSYIYLCSAVFLKFELSIAIL